MCRVTGFFPFRTPKHKVRETVEESSNKNNRYFSSVGPETFLKSDGATSYVKGKYERSCAKTVTCNHLKIRLLFLSKIIFHNVTSSWQVKYRQWFKKININRSCIWSSCNITSISKPFEGTESLCTQYRYLKA